MSDPLLYICNSSIQYDGNDVECLTIERNGQDIEIPQYLMTLFSKKVQKYMSDLVTLPDEVESITFKYKTKAAQRPLSPTCSERSVQVDRRRKR